MRTLLKIFVLLIYSTAQAEISHPIQGKLDNGLQYTLLPLHAEKGRLEIRMKVNAGSVDENDDQAGVAHMVEHLVFRGTEKYPSGLMPYLHENKWVRARNYNAVTTNDNTTYMLTPPKGANLEQSLSVLSEMLFKANLTQADLDDERKIITEEWRQGQGVGARMNRLRTESIRGGSRYVRHPVIGTQESIATMPAEQLQNFYRTFYVPNNMQLLIVGDIEIAQAKQLIADYFSAFPAQKLPIRDYYEPALSNQLRTVQLQDPQSGVSQIAYIFRFDEHKNREQTEQGRYERLIDRLALATLNQRLRNQQPNLPSGVRSLVVRKSDIGKTTVALGIFSSVDEKSHQTGLAHILTEIERLKRFPITQKELDKQKSAIQAQIDNAKNHKSDREFGEWMQAMLATVLSDKPYLPQPELARLTEPMLHKITLAEINQRIVDWLHTQDRIVQYQAPRLTPISAITETMVADLQAVISRQELTEPQQEREITPMSLEALSEVGKIVDEQVFATQNVKRWTLSNGDKVVWLQLPLAENRTYLLAQSDADLTWQSQLASQLIAQNAPLDWEIEQLNAWKQLNKVNLFIKQMPTKLRFEGNVENHKLADLFRLYYAYQLETNVKAGLDETKEELIRQMDLDNSTVGSGKDEQQSEEQERSKALSQLRYGVNATQTVPLKTELETLTAEDLNRQWQKMRSVPTTFYLVSNLAENELKPLIMQYLAPISRDKAIKVTPPIMAKAGKGTAKFAMNLAPKDDVRVWFFNEHKWQGKDAMLVSILRHIALNKLKHKLRDETLGLYSLRFESTLNPATQRVESELVFSSNPDLTEKLITLAKEVLAELPNQITEQDIQQAKAQFMPQEKVRLQQVETWLNRLILSFEQNHNAEYLSEMQSLAEHITLEQAKQMAKLVYSAKNQQVFIITPKQK